MGVANQDWIYSRTRPSRDCSRSPSHRTLPRNRRIEACACVSSIERKPGSAFLVRARMPRTTRRKNQWMSPLIRTADILRRCERDRRALPALLFDSTTTTEDAPPSAVFGRWEAMLLKAMRVQIPKPERSALEIPGLRKPRRPGQPQLVLCPQASRASPPIQDGRAAPDSAKPGSTGSAAVDGTPPKSQSPEHPLGASRYKTAFAKQLNNK